MQVTRIVVTDLRELSVTLLLDLPLVAANLCSCVDTDAMSQRPINRRIPVPNHLCTQINAKMHG